MAGKVPPLRYIGNFDVAAEGKTMWEILCQLRDLGKGRYVTKTEWKLRWPNQKSYLKIVKARPEMDPWFHKGKVWAEFVFRGRNLGIYEFANDLNRADWKLVHKHEEPELVKAGDVVGDYVLPSSFPLPPLQNYFARRTAEKQSREWNAEKDGRAPLGVVLDPQFQVYADLIKQEEPKNKSQNVYDEANPEAFLDWYGAVLPTKVEAWSHDPAVYEPRWKLEDCPTTK